MKCNDINRILDEHALSGLSAAERTELNTHLVDCDACVESISAYEALRDDLAADAAPGLLHRIVADLPDEARRPVSRTAPMSWQTIGGLAATGAIVLIAALSIIGPEPNVADSSVAATVPESAAPDTTAPGFAADTIDDRADPVLPRRVEIAGPVFVEGEHFVALDSAERSVDVLNRVTAWVFYMWSCYFCYEFEDELSEWIERQDTDRINVVRVPVQWNPVVELHARAFYASRLLGVESQVHDAFFETIHERNDILASRDEIADLFARLGIDRAAFDDVFESELVTAELRRGRELAARFGIDATPTVVVDGLFETSPALAGSHEATVEVLDWLVARSREARASQGDPRLSSACDLSDRSGGAGGAADATNLEDILQQIQGGTTVLPGTGRDAVPGGSRQGVLFALDAEILRTREMLESLRLRFTDRHPRVVTLEQRLRLLESQRDAELEDCGGGTVFR